MVNIVRSEFDSALEAWQSSIRSKLLRDWAGEFCSDYEGTLLRAARKGVPPGELLGIVKLLKTLKSRDEDSRRLAEELRATLVDGKKRLRPLIRKIISHLRRKPVLLTYFRFPLDDYLERAERKLSELPSMPPGQPRKEISTQRAVLLARLFQEHTRSPQWDLVAEIFGAFEEEVPGDTGKRVRRQAPARRDWSGPIASAIPIPPMGRIRARERKAWRALMAEQMERDMLDREVKDFRARRGAKRRKGRRNTIKAD
jgi:hypothetical protein